jgi:putative peptidoglycan lipid II flippase
MVGGFGAVIDAAAEIDANLGGAIGARRNRALLEAAAAERKILAHLKKRDPAVAVALPRVRNHLAPLGLPQERVLNVVPFLAMRSRRCCTTSPRAWMCASGRRMARSMHRPPPAPSPLRAADPPASPPMSPEDATPEEAAGLPQAAADAETVVEPNAPGSGPRSSAVGSAMVAAGIFLSRIAGLVREAVIAGYLGTSLYADAFRAGLRMPNVLQNLLGEGTLSASFIPVYSELLQQGRKEDAGRVAGAIFALLLAVAGGISLIGVVFAPQIVDVFLLGYEGERRELTISITRIIFPMTGVLVLSAWSLGILNSHRHFFLPYFAPVLWNVAIIATAVLVGRGMDPAALAVALAWGALAGGVLQLAVQLPTVLRLERSLKIRWDLKMAEVREAVSNAGPAIMGRGVVQLSAWLDVFLASLLAVGAVSVILYAQTLYILPISLFGMSVAAAELPELSRQRQGSDEVLRARASAGLERIAFYVFPSFFGYLLLGDVIVGGIYQRGEFTADDTLRVYLSLAALSVGLVATTASRMLSSTFFALRDTATPARYAAVRVSLAVVIGVSLMLMLEGVVVDKVGLHIPGGPLSHLRVGGCRWGWWGSRWGRGSPPGWSGRCSSARCAAASARWAGARRCWPAWPRPPSWRPPRGGSCASSSPTR